MIDPLETSLSLSNQCRLLNISRSGIRIPFLGRQYGESDKPIISDENSLSDAWSIGEKGLVCQGGECYNILGVGDELSFVGVRELQMGRG